MFNKVKKEIHDMETYTESRPRTMIDCWVSLIFWPFLKDSYTNIICNSFHGPKWSLVNELGDEAEPQLSMTNG